MSVRRTTRMRVEVGPRPANAFAGDASAPSAVDTTCAASPCGTSGETGDAKVSILLVDDRPENLVVLEAMLAGSGRNLVRATSGQEALQCCQEQDFAVILLDVQMPGMDGFETATFIRQRERSRDTPIIFVTAIDDDANSARKGYSLGAVDFIFKPIVPVVLNAKVSVFIALFLRTAEVKRQVELLRQSQERYTNIVENSTDGIVVLSPEETILYANPTAAALFGRPRENLVGTPLGMPVSAGEMTELDIVRPGGEQSTAEMHVGRTDWNGRPTVIITLHDITERKRAEDAIRHAQEEDIRRRDRFLSHASHELRAPVTAIYQFVTIILDGLAGAPSPEQRGYLQIVLRNVEDLKSMIGDLMDVTRGEAEGWDLRSEAVDIVPFIKQAQSRLEHLAQARNIMVTMTGPDRLPEALADPKRIVQVVLNLVTHAVQHTPEGGTVRVEWRVDTENEACVRVSVSDGAETLSEHDRLHMFDKMHQVGDAIDDGRKGLGLGLHIAQELVCRQDGRIWVEREATCGNTFSFTLPLSSRSDTPATQVEDQARDKKP